MVLSMGVLEKDAATNDKEVKGGSTLPPSWWKMHYQQNWTLGEGKTKVDLMQ